MPLSIICRIWNLDFVWYATGLRVSELCQLKVGDVDSKRMMLSVSNGRGGKDRYTILSPMLLEALRIYWHAFHPKIWLFGTCVRDEPISDRQGHRHDHFAVLKCRDSKGVPK